MTMGSDPVDPGGQEGEEPLALVASRFPGHTDRLSSSLTPSPFLVSSWSVVRFTAMATLATLGSDPVDCDPEPQSPSLRARDQKPVIASPKGAAICPDRHVASLLAMTGYLDGLPAGAVPLSKPRIMRRPGSPGGQEGEEPLALVASRFPGHTDRLSSSLTPSPFLVSSWAVVRFTGGAQRRLPLTKGGRCRKYAARMRA
jgi:hypothetical protein